MDNLQEKILNKIRQGEVVMRPRLYFTLRAVALALVVLAVLVLSVFICNFIFFTLRLNGHESLLARPGGLLLFLRFFPWELLVLDAAFVILLEWMLRRFKFAYQRPTAYLAFGLLVVVLSAGFALDRGTRFNDSVLDRADHGGLPRPFGDVYEHAHRPLPPGFRPDVIRYEINTAPAL
jgi:hypothetical protein